MRLSLSTNWCNRRLESGEEIADAALALGFEELELGFHTTQFQVKGFRSRLDRIPVGSIHAFCPVPISAPQGYPELYLLASFDEEGRRMARLQVRRNVDFAAGIGADTVVLHAGRVGFGTLFDRLDSCVLRGRLARSDNRADDPKYAKTLARAAKRRSARGGKMLDVFLGELASLLPDLERNRVTLALENLPYLEGFPLRGELARILAGEFGGWVKGWYDTGHARVCEMHGWEGGAVPSPADYAGMHLNDVFAFEDEHLPPGEGNVDFAALGSFAAGVRHVVFEPSAAVSSDRLRAGLAHIRKLWMT